MKWKKTVLGLNGDERLNAIGSIMEVIWSLYGHMKWPGVGGGGGTGTHKHTHIHSSVHNFVLIKNISCKSLSSLQTVGEPENTARSSCGE